MNIVESNIKRYKNYTSAAKTERRLAEYAMQGAIGLRDQPQPNIEKIRKKSEKASVAARRANSIADAACPGFIAAPEPVDVPTIVIGNRIKNEPTCEQKRRLFGQREY